MDFYVILGLERTASLGEIKRAYRRLARRYHPDINPGDRTAATQFRMIAEAYETLMDPDRRRRYDTNEMEPSIEASTFGFEGFDFSVSADGLASPTFGDLFADVLHERARRRTQDGPTRGADLHHGLTFTLDQAMRGGPHVLSITRHEHCHLCRGAGRVRMAEIRCPSCHGGGIVKSARGHMVFSKPCAACGGSGHLNERRCPACSGQQIEVRSESLTVNVPPGLADGARIRIPGKGHSGPAGYEHGDLFITVHVQPHAMFRREGNDVHVVVPVAVHEAALGAKLDVPTLDGPARLRIPPGAQSGQRFRVRERGMPSPQDGQRGDLVVEIRLVLPRMLDERSKELLREFGRINGEDVRRELLGPSGGAADTTGR